MPQLDKLVDIAAAALQNDDTNYRAALQDTALAVWAIVGRLAPFDFLKPTTPFALDVVANEPTYELNKKEIDRLGAITNADLVPLWFYKTRTEFNNRLRGMTGQDTEDRGIFTVIGYQSGHKVIRLYPIPATTVSLKLWHSDKPSKDNIDNCPDDFIKPMLHGIKSMVEPPYELTDPNKRLKWLAQTYKEDQLFIQWIKRQLHFHIESDQHVADYTIDEFMSGQIDEANAL